MPPARLFDAHLHIVDPAFATVPNAGYAPAPFTATNYRRAVAGLGVAGGAVVAGSFQPGTAWLEAALAALGPAFVGVARLEPDVDADEIRRLDALGVRAVRFALHRGDRLDVALARRVWEVAGWHAELYVDAAALPGLPLAALPCVMIDHLGLSAEGLPHLVRAVRAGAFVKATGFGRLPFDPADAIRQLVEARPEAVVVGTDLPSTRAPRPFRASDLALVRDMLPPDLAEAVLWRNARALYRPRA